MLEVEIVKATIVGEMSTVLVVRMVMVWNRVSRKEMMYKVVPWSRKTQRVKDTL